MYVNEDFVFLGSFQRDLVLETTWKVTVSRKLYLALLPFQPDSISGCLKTKKPATQDEPLQVWALVAGKPQCL